MYSDDEDLDPLSTPRSSQSPFQALLFPRHKVQKFMPLTAPSRHGSFRTSYTNLAGLRHETAQHRSIALLQRTNFPTHPWEKWRKSDEELRAIKKKKVRRFYEEQNCLIDDLLAVDEILESPVPQKIIHSYHRQSIVFSTPPSRTTTIDEESSPLLAQQTGTEHSSRIVNLAIYINFAANVFLLAAKVIVTLTSSSLSLLASLVDSILDFTSTVIIYTVSRIVQHRDWRSKHQFPVGKARLEPLGVLVFAVIMIVSFIQVCVEAVQRLLADVDHHEVVALSLQSMLIMGSTVVVKFGCWLWGRSIKNSGVEALTQDAMNDVIFNTFSLIFPLIGQFAKIWWLDSVGAIVISLYIILEWIQTAYSHIRKLTGTAASKAQLQQIIYMASRFSDRILRVMNVSGYHAGDNILVEVDIVLDEKMPLKDVHDLGEALQYSIESLPGVERAFVHSDYRESNPSGHIRGG